MEPNRPKRIQTNQNLELKLYSPHRLQHEMHMSPARFKISAWGRQSGKTTWGLNHILMKAWRHPGTRYWFVSPTEDQSMDIYRRCLGLLWNSPDAILAKSDSRRRIMLLSMSAIEFKSGGTLHNLRGPGLHGVVIDEVRDQHPELWPLVIRSMLTVTKGWAAFISTPNGFDEFFDMFEAAANKPEWARWQSPSIINPYFTQEEFSLAQSEMTDNQFRQEIMAEFLDLTKGKAYKFTDANIRDDTPFLTSDPDKVISDKYPVVVGMDFNLNPMSWTLGQCDKLKWHWFDEVYLEDSDTQEAAEALVAKLSYYRARNMLRSSPQLVICGDATAKAGQRAAAGKSDYDIVLQRLKSAGFSFVNITPESNPPVRDRVNTVNQKLSNASGSIGCTISRRGCPELIKDLQRVVWKSPGILDQTRDPMRTHPSDSIGYPMCELTPIKPINDVGKLRVIVR